MSTQQESPRRRFDAVEQGMREMRIESRIRIEVSDLDHDATIIRQFEVAQTIDPRGEICRVVTRKLEHSLGFGMEICRAFPERGVQRVYAVSELLQARDVVRQQIVLVVERDGAALE